MYYFFLDFALQSVYINMIPTWNVQYMNAVTLIRSFAGVPLFLTYTCMINYTCVDSDQDCDNLHTNFVTWLL